MLSEAIRIHRQSNTYSSAKQYVFKGKVRRIHFASIINIHEQVSLIKPTLKK